MINFTSFAVGALVTLIVGVVIALAAIPKVYTPTVPHTIQPLPDWARSVLRWGEPRRYIVRPTPPKRTWRRMQEHLSGLMDQLVADLANRLEVEPPDSFAAWWERTEIDYEKRIKWYAGRHRREDFYVDPAWRARWAAYDTQGWPTLTTTGDAWHILSERPIICTANINWVWREGWAKFPTSGYPTIELREDADHLGWAGLRGEDDSCPPDLAVLSSEVSTRHDNTDSSRTAEPSPVR